MLGGGAPVELGAEGGGRNSGKINGQSFHGCSLKRVVTDLRIPRVALGGSIGAVRRYPPETMAVAVEHLTLAVALCLLVAVHGPHLGGLTEIRIAYNLNNLVPRGDAPVYVCGQIIGGDGDRALYTIEGLDMAVRVFRSHKVEDGARPITVRSGLYKQGLYVMAIKWVER